MIEFQNMVAVVTAIVVLCCIYKLFTTRSNGSGIHVKPIISGPKASQPPAPGPSVKITELKPVKDSKETIAVYEFQKQEQWEAFTKLWDEGSYISCDSISLDDQLKRLLVQKEGWESIFFENHKKMGKTLSMDDYHGYARHAFHARGNIKRIEEQMDYLKAAISANSRAVGNYTPDRITTPSLIKKP